MGDSKLLYYKYKAFLRQVFRQQQRGSANITAKQTIYIKKEQALIETRKKSVGTKRWQPNRNSQFKAYGDV